MVRITGTDATAIGSAYGILVTVNTGLTGTVTIADTSSTRAVITNPAVGNSFTYYGFTGAITVTASAAGDITVSMLNRQG